MITVNLGSIFSTAGPAIGAFAALGGVALNSYLKDRRENKAKKQTFRELQLTEFYLPMRALCYEAIAKLDKVNEYTGRIVAINPFDALRLHLELMHGEFRSKLGLAKEETIEFFVPLVKAMESMHAENLLLFQDSESADHLSMILEQFADELEKHCRTLRNPQIVR